MCGAVGKATVRNLHSYPTRKTGRANIIKNLSCVLPDDACKTQQHQVTLGTNSDSLLAARHADHVLMYLTDGHVQAKHLCNPDDLKQTKATFSSFQPGEHRNNKWLYVRSLMKGYNAEHHVFILNCSPSTEMMRLKPCQLRGTGTFPIENDSWPVYPNAASSVSSMTARPGSNCPADAAAGLGQGAPIGLGSATI